MSVDDDAGKATDDYAAALRQAGVDPRQFVEFVQRMTGTGTPDGGADNVPGFEFAARVSAAAGRALQMHAEAMNQAWSEIRRGRFGFTEALQTWAVVAENYYGVVVEAWRGPLAVRRPSWLVLSYSVTDPPPAEHSVRVDGVLDKELQLEYTRLEGLGHVASTNDVFEGVPIADGARVRIRFRKKELAKLGQGTDHIGFIVEKGRGPSPPLVIIMLRVAPAPAKA